MTSPMFTAVLCMIYFQATSISASYASPIVETRPSLSCCSQAAAGSHIFHLSLTDIPEHLNFKDCSSSPKACASCGGVICTHPIIPRLIGHRQSLRRLQLLVEGEEEESSSRFQLVAAAAVIVLGILGYVMASKYFECPLRRCRRPFSWNAKDQYSEVGEHFESWEMEIDHDVLLL